MKLPTLKDMKKRRPLIMAPVLLIGIIIGGVIAFVLMSNQISQDISIFAPEERIMLSVVESMPGVQMKGEETGTLIQYENMTDLSTTIWVAWIAFHHLDTIDVSMFSLYYTSYDDTMTPIDVHVDLSTVLSDQSAEGYPYSKVSGKIVWGSWPAMDVFYIRWDFTIGLTAPSGDYEVVVWVAEV